MVIFTIFNQSKFQPMVGGGGGPGGGPSPYLLEISEGENHCTQKAQCLGQKKIFQSRGGKGGGFPKKIITPMVYLGYIDLRADGRSRGRSKGRWHKT